MAITAPSVVSYLRLTPHRWSAAFNNLGFRDREASVRICPVSDLSDIAKAAQFNFEFRAADARRAHTSSSPRSSTPACKASRSDCPCPRRPRKICRCSILRHSRRAATFACRNRCPKLSTASRRIKTVAGWFPDGFADVYVKHKSGEIAFVGERSQAEICAAYEEVY